MTGVCVFGMRMLYYTVYWSLWPQGDDERGTVIVLISRVSFIFAVFMQVNIPICDIFDIYDMITMMYIIIFILFQRFKTALYSHKYVYNFWY